MAAATDRDLLSLEPALLRDLSFAGQRLTRIESVDVTGTTLTAAGADFTAVGIVAGHVALVGETPLEIIEAPSAETLTVSLLRATRDDAAIPPGDVAGATLSISTFAPQIAIVHGQLLAILGIGPGGSDEAVTEDAITNPEALRLVEAYGALELIFTAAASLVTEADLLWTKARTYRRRFALQRARLVLHLDLDGDGVVDATRRGGVVQLRRS
jgi:hypothetical protein